MSTCCAPTIGNDEPVRAAEGRLRAEEFARSGRTDSAGLVHYVVTVPSIHCADCISTLEAGLSAITGVRSARVNFSTRRVAVATTAALADPFDIVRTIERLGYPAMLGAGESDGRDPVLSQLMRALVVAGFGAANVMLLSVSVWAGADHATRTLFQLISGLIAVPAVLYAGRPFFRSAWSALRRGGLNMDVPIAIGVLLTLGNSVYEATIGGGETWFEAPVMLIFFLLIGRVLDHVMREKARSGIDNLSRLAARGAIRVGPDGGTDFVAVEEIRPGMVLQIAAGERFPVDGVLLDGQATDIDRSLATGESLPVSVGSGDKVEAGALNLAAPVHFEARADADHSLIHEMMRLMEAAEQGKASYVRLADRISSIYAPFVHLASALTFVGWIATGHGAHAAFSAAVAVLIITCPCALGLAVPVAQVVGAGVLLRRGILVRTGSAFERMAEVKQVIFDKTGTLTLPTLQLDDDLSEENLGLIAALASQSRHPLSVAVASEARRRGIIPEAASELAERPGYGMEGRIAGRRARLGRQDWALEIAATYTSDRHGDLWFAIEGQAPVRLTIRAELRPGSRATMQAFDQRGLPRYLLSGDAPASVAAVGAMLGFSEANIAARIGPSGKAERIEALQAANGPALFVGDGINDAPALGTAHVSITPSDASEVGRASADFVFTGRSLGAVSDSYLISKAVLACVRENMALAILYNIIAVPMAIIGLVTPLGAAIAMSTSSMIVVGNSLRLRLKLRQPVAEPQDEEPKAAGRALRQEVRFG
ncbi:heavy metal translocating P-type ATPase [Kaistia algarum]|uniref:heavy metal translocating P-type ATPase n=1 Tax=Kaistia algarum TaxID=2083279 RepID=UPI0014026554|nr:heavy metal translocating P-type ATPase [Kaistia algarum]MCX5512720.1 heavy metal translocating P-type ATPase [Kaistia algarum]